MPVQDTTRIVDGSLSLEGGIDSGFPPSFLPGNQAAWAVNTTFRGGNPTCRPGYKNLNHQLTQGRFQGAGTYVSDTGTPYIVSSISGHIYATNLSTLQTLDITPYDGNVVTGAPFTVPVIGASVTITVNQSNQLVIGQTYTIGAGVYTLTALPDYYHATFTNNTAVLIVVVPALTIIYQGATTNPVRFLDYNNPNNKHVWFQQAEYWLIIQDGAAKPILWDGLNARRATVGEVPTGQAMAYGKGRLWVSQGSQYVGGDIVYGDPALGRGSVIKFTENDFLNEGGAFAVPGGPITGMTFAANIDTTLGDGDLVVFNRNNVFTFSAPVDRTIWKNLTYPLQRYAIIDYGSFNQESIVRVNGDLVFRADDGVRSMMYARRDFVNTEGMAPISRQATRSLEGDSQNLLYAASGVNFDNRMLMTVLPQWSQSYGIYHLGLVGLDYYNVSGMGRKITQAWEGTWNGLKFLRVLTVQVNSMLRCYAIHLNASNVPEIWEITRNAPFDQTYVNSVFTDVPIPWTIETKSYQFGDAESIKRLWSGDQWYDGVSGSITGDAWFRADTSPNWTYWNRWTDCATYKNCDPDGQGCATTLVYQPQTRSRVGLPQPPEQVNNQTGTQTRNGYEFQVRYKINGKMNLKRLRVTAQSSPEATFGDLRTSECVSNDDVQCQTGCIGVAGCGFDDTYIL